MEGDKVTGVSSSIKTISNHASMIVEETAADGKISLNKTSDSLKLVRDQNEAKELGGGTVVIFEGSDNESTVSETSVEGPN